MAEFTPSSNLYKWNKADTKLTTITEMAANADKIDAKLSDGINVMSFGASESAENNYQAFVDTINHIRNMLGGRGKIVFPAGKVFKFTQALGSFEISNLMIDLNGSTLDFSSVPASSTDTALMFSGGVGGTYTLTADSLEGTNIVTLSSTTPFKVGDMVKIFSNRLWDSTRTSTKIAEIVYVKSIDSATQMTMTTPLNDSYKLTDAARIHRITPVENVVVMNGTMIGATGDNEMRGLRITRGYNCLIQNMTLKGFDVNQIQLTDCVRSNIIFCKFQEANHATMGYGVSFADACQDCICSNSHFTDVRHSLSTNNNVTTSSGIVRRILFIGNTITDSSPAIGGIGGDAIDTHGGAEDIFIIDNSVFSSSGVGINVEANRATVVGNRIKGTGSVGIQWQPYADGRLSAITLSDNQITHVGDTVGSDYGILCTVRVADCKSVVINGNELESQNGSIRLTAPNSFKFKKGTISANTAKAITAGYAIEVQNSELIAVNGNAVEGLNFGIGFTDSSNCTANGNTVNLSGTSGTGYGVRITGTTKRSSAVGNIVNHTGTLATSYGVRCEDTATYNMLIGNVSENCSNPSSAGTGTGNVVANNI